VRTYDPRKRDESGVGIREPKKAHAQVVSDIRSRSGSAGIQRGIPPGARGAVVPPPVQSGLSPPSVRVAPRDCRFELVIDQGIHKELVKCAGSHIAILVQIVAMFF
jgi:hypothetical protein